MVHASCAEKLRPEAFGGSVHMTASGQAHYPLNADVLGSTALHTVFSKSDTYFLPQAFPEGSPQHPSYTQGHATMAGACATILKAAFDGRVQFNTLPDGTIVRANENGHSLVSYTGSDANQKSTAKSTSSHPILVRPATSPRSTGGRIMNGGCGSARQRRSAFFATRATTMSARISRASPSPSSVERG